MSEESLNTLFSFELSFWTGEMSLFVLLTSSNEGYNTSRIGKTILLSCFFFGLIFYKFLVSLLFDNSTFSINLMDYLVLVFCQESRVYSYWTGLNPLYNSSYTYCFYYYSTCYFYYYYHFYYYYCCCSILKFYFFTILTEKVLGLKVDSY